MADRNSSSPCPILRRALSGLVRYFLPFESKTVLLTCAITTDLGAGTGSNVEYMEKAGQLGKFSKVHLVDLSTSLLKRADKYIEENNWHNVTTVEADATTFVPPEKKVDLVTFSYSLTM